MTRRGASVMPPAVRRAIVAHARRERPRECCGLLVGRGRRVDRRRADGERRPRARVRYRIDDAAHIDAAARAARVRRRRSRSSASITRIRRATRVPSPTDIAEAHYPDWLHVIVGLRPPSARSAPSRSIADVCESSAIASGAARANAVEYDRAFARSLLVRF